jgi:hypothetical protein
MGKLRITQSSGTGVELKDPNSNTSWYDNQWSKVMMPETHSVLRCDRIMWRLSLGKRDHRNVNARGLRYCTQGCAKFRNSVRMIAQCTRHVPSLGHPSSLQYCLTPFLARHNGKENLYCFSQSCVTTQTSNFTAGQQHVIDPANQ